MSSRSASTGGRTVAAACRGPLSVEETAKLLRLPVAQVCRAVHAGQLPAVRRNGAWYVDGPRLLALFHRPAVRTDERPC